LGLLKPPAKPWSTAELVVAACAGAVGVAYADGAAVGAAAASSGANSTVNVEPDPNPGGITMAFKRPSGACT
jgi:hypothetical protein